VATLARGVAFVAVVLAVVAIGVAVTALSRTSDGKTQAGATTQAPPAPAPATTRQAPPTDPSAPVAPSAGSSPEGEPPVPDSEPQIAYTEHELRIQPSVSCSNERLVDLDEPRVGADDNKAEFSYGVCGGTVAQLDFVNELGLADVSSPTASGRDCLLRIQDAPINEPLTPSAGLTLCVRTLQNEAAQEGITRKVIRIAIRSVAGDGTMVVRVTAWNLPS
jgi:hypothetical protein